MILVITGSGIGVSPVRCYAIIQTNDDLLLTDHSAINFSQILNHILNQDTDDFQEIVFKTVGCGGLFLFGQPQHFAHSSFKCIFFQENVCYSCKFQWSLFIKGQLSASTGWGNGLAPNRQQAITWTNVDLDPWLHMATPGHKELHF